MTFLSNEDWNKYVCRVCGAEDVEHLAPVDPTSWWWPPKGMPPSLYRDVIYLRTKSFYLFHATSVLKWSLIILQILIGATLTALGSYSASNGTPITVLGAINTVVAGLLALIHNSGLPDRLRCDMAEFERVEDHIREILDTRIVPSNKSIEQVVAECFELYRNAKATIAANMPATYNSSQARVR
ncbi:C6 transcription factor [Fusarium mundagurra]|uniref:C6 transcription factor n=1 Tax=Fusarium mundagurra TaxID=1567541 RepID=A0A8H6CVL4_9HYPO|nr:C6 transcription factor [Fusarium mundagurra]